MLVVTGGAGFIGSALVWEFNRHDVDDVLIVDRLGSDDKWRNLRALRFVDVMDPADFLARFEAGSLAGGVRAVAHLGACATTTERDADFLYQNNFDYARRLAMAAVGRGIRFVHASSAATYGDGGHGYADDPAGLDRLRPLNMYAWSKHRFDLHARDRGWLDRVAVLKFFNVYGPNEYHKGEMASLVHKAVRQIRDTGTLNLFKSHRPEYPDGGQKRDFVYVKDVVRLMRHALDHPDLNGLYNVGSGTARSWNDLARAVFAAMDKPPKIHYIDMPPALRGQYQYFTEARMDWLAQANLPYRLSTLEEGVTDYVRRYLLREDPYLDPASGAHWQEEAPA